MSETYNFTYNDLISNVVDKIKNRYYNIDSINSALKDGTVFAQDSNSRYVLSTAGTAGDRSSINSGRWASGSRNSSTSYGNGDFKGLGCKFHGAPMDNHYHGSWDFIGGTNAWMQGKWVQSNTSYGPKTKAMTFEHTLTNICKVTAQSSSEITNYITNKVPEICDCSSVSEKVTTKGLLAFFNFILWLLAKSTTVIQTIGYGESSVTDYPCFNLNTGYTYSGIKNTKADNDVIKRSDFDSFLGYLRSFTSSIGAANMGLDEKFSCSSSSSCCSSSSCSSSCSSSSSSSSIFIAYLSIA